MIVERDARRHRPSQMLVAAAAVLSAGFVASGCNAKDQAAKTATVAKAEPAALQVGGLPVT